MIYIFVEPKNHPTPIQKIWATDMKKFSTPLGRVNKHDTSQSQFSSLYLRSFHMKQQQIYLTLTSDSFSIFAKDFFGFEMVLLTLKLKCCSFVFIKTFLTGGIFQVCFF